MSGSIRDLLARYREGAKSQREKGTYFERLASAAASMLLPCAFSLYLIVDKGIWRAYRSVTGTGVAFVFIGLFWIAAGWRMLSVLGRLQRH